MTIDNHQDEIGIIGYVLGFSLLFFLIVAGIISYNKSIDWDVLKKMESQQLILPPISTQSAQITAPVSTPSNTKK